MKQVEPFKYLGSMISENGACEDEEVKHAVGKLREKSGIVCDKSMPIMLKAAV